MAVTTCSRCLTASTRLDFAIAFAKMDRMRLKSGQKHDKKGEFKRIFELFAVKNGLLSLNFTAETTIDEIMDGNNAARTQARGVVSIGCDRIC